MALIDEKRLLEVILKELQSMESAVHAIEKKDTLRVAGMGLLFINKKNLWDDFRHFLLESEKPLSEDQIRHLISLGIQV